MSLPVILQLREDKKLATFNVEEDSNRSPSDAKAAEESLTALLHTVVQATPNTPIGARCRTRRSQQYYTIHLSAALRRGYRDIAGTGHTL